MSWSKPEQGGYAMSIGLGLAMSVAMLLAWFLLGDAIDATLLSDALEPVGLLNPTVYLLATVYWILFNSLLEEYVFRWFLVIKSETLVGPGNPAIILSLRLPVVGECNIQYSDLHWWRCFLMALCPISECLDTIHRPCDL